MFNVLDLFSGIGGFSLGLERTGGFRTAAFCEIDPAAQKVLTKHWPATPIFKDVSLLTKRMLDETVGVSVDVITGGFPCQDISFAGRGAGLSGERSGLWFQFHRLVQEVQPRYAIIENVSALRTRGLDSVLGSLAQIGYDAEWHCIPASALGAPHRRDRIWIVAYPGGSRRETRLPAQGHRQEGLPEISDYLGRRLAGWAGQSFWAVESSVGRVGNGIPNRVDRLKQLGNAVVPQIPELIGKALLDYEQSLQPVAHLTKHS